MNKLRKLTCLLLALVMVFALAATASAADAYTITKKMRKPATPMRRIRFLQAIWPKKMETKSCPTSSGAVA